MLYTVGKEVRDRFSGAIEAFARRNASPRHHGDHSRHRASDGVPSSKDVVNTGLKCLFLILEEI